MTVDYPRQTLTDVIWTLRNRAYIHLGPKTSLRDALTREADIDPRFNNPKRLDYLLAFIAEFTGPLDSPYDDWPPDLSRRLDLCAKRAVELFRQKSVL